MIAAASWPPRAPPALRTTVFTAVADPVRAAGTAETTWFGSATRQSQNPTPRTEVAAYTCHGASCQRARLTKPAAQLSMPAISCARRLNQRCSRPENGPRSSCTAAVGSMNRPAPVTDAPKP